MGVSSGNEADLHMEDYLEYYAQDPSVDAIVAYVESVPEGRRFFERCRAVTARKPVVVLKGGRTRSGQSAASSHTGALAVSDHLFSSACTQAGIIQARTIEDAGILAASFVNRPLPRGNRVAVVTGGGGLGVIGADICSDEGLDVVKLSRKTIDKLAGLLPDWWVPGNPVDLVAGNRFETVLPIMETLIESGEIDAMIFTFVGPPKYSRRGLPRQDRGVDPAGIMQLLGRFYKFFSERLCQLSMESGVAIYPVINLAEMADADLAGLLGERPMSIYRNVEPACLALGAMSRYQRFLRQIGLNEQNPAARQRRCASA
jgi:acyl-CoA synthetase (NDP forming)